MTATVRAAPAEAGGAGLLGRALGQVPWRTVLLAWAASRLLLGAVLVTAGSLADGRFSFEVLWSFDGAWYTGIAETGYGDPPRPGVQSHWPFFPLFPMMGKVVALSGLATPASLAVVSNLALVVALAGVWRAARRWLGPGSATTTVWLAALMPSAAVYSMAYPSSLFLAGTVWAAVLLDERRDLAAGVAAAVATMVRPNGAVLLVALGLALLLATRTDTGRWSPPPLGRVLRVLGPPGVALVAWLATLWHWTGNPFVFWEAKSAWDEVQLHEFATDPDRSEVPHVVTGLVGIALVLAARRVPPAWRAFGLLYLAPSLLLGVVGLARYASECFPVVLAAAGVVGRIGEPVRQGMLAVVTVTAVVLAVAIARLAIVP